MSPFQPTLYIPLERNEIEMLGLDIPQEEWIQVIPPTTRNKSTLLHFPEKRTMEVFEKLKTAFMMDMTLKYACWYAGINKRTRWNRAQLYGQRSENLSTLHEQWSEAMHLTAKMMMFQKLMEGDTALIKHVVQAKDPKYRLWISQEEFESVANVLGLVSTITPEAKKFILKKTEWNKNTDDWQNNNSTKPPW